MKISACGHAQNARVGARAGRRDNRRRQAGPDCGLLQWPTASRRAQTGGRADRRCPQGRGTPRNR
eukprot:7510437-Pyramimonas_sp.AAC.1